MNEKILVTSALPYVNNVPHLGNLIGCLLSADVYSRYQRLVGKNVLFVCGTDEYGTTTEQKAKELGITPRELCNKYHALHTEIYDWFNISFDVFGRTSTDDPVNDKWTHTELCHDIFNDLVDNGFIVEKKLRQLYCTKTNKYLADRFIKGNCPYCKSADQNGDQCDDCGTLYEPFQLTNPYNVAHPDAKLVVKESDELFLKLSAFKQQLIDWWITKKNWSGVANSITKNWLNDQLLDRCITRDLEWGTPVPDTKKFGNKHKNKVFYVWFDAPIGYISITAHARRDWKEWWMNKKTKVVNFMAKDNVPFHSVMFPSTLLGTNKSYNLVDVLSSCDYLNYNGKKFSKSRRIGVFGDDAMTSGFDSDLWRFYLIKIRPENGDSSFKWVDFLDKVNGELVNNFSNLVNRILILTYKNFGKIPEITDQKLFESLDTKYQQTLIEYNEEFTNVRLRNALNKLLEFSSICNEFLNEHSPWNSIKEKKEYAKNTLGVLCHFLVCLSVMSEQFIPNCSDKIQLMLNISHHDLHLRQNEFADRELQKPSIIFKRLKQEDVDKLKEQFD
jgi:methionyl-tRNA synthetase